MLIKPGSELWVTNDGQYRVLFEPTAWQEIDVSCEASRNLETGGILIGYYSSDQTTATITRVSGPPTDSRRGRTWFRRGVAGLKDLLERHWNANYRQHYVGEWHFHPAVVVEPSNTDFEEMVQISTSPCYQCREPLMVIAGTRTASGRPLRVFVFPSGSGGVELFNQEPSKV